MKTLLISALLLTFPSWGYLYAQNPMQQCRLTVVPPLPPDGVVAIPLSYMGLRKKNYSVLVKVRLPGSPLYYTLPGVLPTGDSFSFQLKSSKHQQTDTLFLIRRGGEKTMLVAEIWVLALRRSSVSMGDYPRSTYHKTLLTVYYNPFTTRKPSDRNLPPPFQDKRPAPVINTAFSINPPSLPTIAHKGTL